MKRDDESCPWGKLLQLSENAEDYRKPKKGLAKHSAAAQRKRCRAASRADASPRSVRGRSENIKIRLTRRRRDLVEIKINDKKKAEIGDGGGRRLARQVESFCSKQIQYKRL